jgi:hypothetical protein
MAKFGWEVPGCSLFRGVVPGAPETPRSLSGEKVNEALKRINDLKFMLNLKARKLSNPQAIGSF